MKQTFTHDQVEKLIKGVIIETSKGIMNWLEKETEVIDKRTKKKIKYAIITHKKNGKGISAYTDYRFKKHGLTFTRTNKK